MQRCRMRCDDGKGQTLGPRVDPAGGDGARGDGERQTPGAMEQLELGRGEQERVQVRERLALDGRAEVQHCGILLPDEGQAGAEVRVRADALLRRHFERPPRGDDLPQQRQRTLDVESLVGVVRLSQDLGRAVLSPGLRGEAREHRETEGEPLHVPPPRVRRATRPRETVPPAGITMVVSNVS